MKCNAYLLIALAALPVASPAQDVTLNGHSAAATPLPVVGSSQLSSGGTAAASMQWLKEADHVDETISKAKLAKMKEVTGALVDFLQDSALAGGYSSSWHGEYFSGKNSPGAQLKFGMTCHFAAQRADLSITANDLQPLMDQLVVNGQHFLTMRIANSVGEGVLNYTDVAADDSGMRTKRWIVAANKGLLPYTSVTRKEYLIAAKAELTAMVNSIVTGWKMKAPVRSTAAQEAERKAVIDQLKTMYSGADLDIRTRVYVRCYKSDEDFQKENIEKETAGFRETIRVIDSLMAHLGAAQLSKPAVVSVNAADFHGFEDGQTDYMLIRMNNAYFNNGLSEEKPQIFLVTWQYDPSNETAVQLDTQLAKGMDFEVLQGMLGK